jgi:hypothetical protein
LENKIKRGEFKMEKIKRVLFNEEKAGAVFRIISELWLGKRDIFKNLQVPKIEISEIKDNVQMAHFLFVLVMAERGPVFSEAVINRFVQLWKVRPDIFCPQVIEQMSREDLIRLFAENGIIREEKGFFLKNFFDDWLYNFEVIDKKFQGNILNAFKEVKRFDQLSYLLTLRGIQTKLLAYFVTLLQEYKLIQYFSAPMPVDFHRLRVLWSTDIIDLKAFEQPFEDLPGAVKVNVWYTHINQVSDWSGKFFTENNFSHLIVGPGLWYFSRNRCSKANRKSQKRLKSLETCSCCPLNKFCKWSIPSYPFYSGKSSLLVRYKRNQ